MKAALFIPCLTELFYPQSAISMVKILRHVGVEVEYVEDQTCCGQPAFNSGYRKPIIPIAERFIELFKDKEYVIAPSGSCTAMVRVFFYDLDIREDLKPALKDLSGKIYEFSEFLIKVAKVESLGGRLNARVTYHDSCHLLRELGIRDEPRQLIHGIDGIDFVEMEKSDTCCGFGGTFSLKFKDMSLAMVERKCRYIAESKADFVVGCDSSCLMNIQGYMTKHDMSPKTIHLAELLAQSLEL